MNSIREVINIQGNFINIKLPLDFPKGNAEVFVIPVNSKQKNTHFKPNLPELINISKKDYASQIILDDRL